MKILLSRSELVRMVETRVAELNNLVQGKTSRVEEIRQLRDGLKGNRQDEELKERWNDDIRNLKADILRYINIIRDIKLLAKSAASPIETSLTELYDAGIFHRNAEK